MNSINLRIELSSMLILWGLDVLTLPLPYVIDGCNKVHAPHVCLAWGVKVEGA